ncbi:MAG: hypothetical protein RLZZ31_109 [Actinomycetota bacterium]|jgi:hypothetical protein
MVIRKGEPYGEKGTIETGLIVQSDYELRAVVLVAEPGAVPLTGLTSGDMCKTLGGRGNLEQRRDDVTLCPIDLGWVTVDGVEHCFVAHCRIGRLFHRNSLMALNAQFWEELDLAPRGHPNDGKLDFLTGGLSFRTRRQALKRAKSGTHLPHPDLSMKSAAEFTFHTRRQRFFLDGIDMGHGSEFVFRCQPDALTVAV